MKKRIYKVVRAHEIEFDRSEILDMLGDLINYDQNKPDEIIEDTIEKIFDSLIGYIPTRRESSIGKIIINAVRHNEEQFDVKKQMKVDNE